MVWSIKRVLAKKNIRDDRGSATLFVMVAIPIMFTLIILVINIGQLIFDRIRLQTTVDACTLAAAARQSTGLNEIAGLNRSAQLEYRNAMANLRGLPWFDSNHGRRAYQFHKKVLDTIEQFRKDANRYFAASAHQYAQSVKNHTMPNTQLVSIVRSYIPRGKLMREGRAERKDISWRYFTSWCQGKDCVPIWGAAHYFTPFPRFTRQGVIPAKYARTANNYMTLRRGPLGGDAGPFKVRWRKQTPPVTFAAYRLSQEQKPLILGNRLFDLTRLSLPSAVPSQYRRYINRFRKRLVLPAMSVYAAAKPTGGDIWNMKAEYRPMMIQLRRVPVSVPGPMEH